MEITQGLAELIGILLGDGYIYRKNRKYQIGFVGNPQTDKEYFEHLKKLIKEEWNKEGKITFRERGIRLVINSKEICSFLIDELKLPHGEGKCEKIKIPEEIMQKWDLVKNTIRGIMDTDGTIFVSKKPGIEKYPTMEITTTSKELANQLHSILSEKGFRVGNIRSSLSKLSKRTAYRVPLYRRKNVIQWIKEIGFSNPYKLRRAEEYTRI